MRGAARKLLGQSRAGITRSELNQGSGGDKNSDRCQDIAEMVTTGLGMDWTVTCGRHTGTEGGSLAQS